MNKKTYPVSRERRADVYLCKGTTTKQFRRHWGAFGGLSPQTKLHPPN